jgi:thymidylate synthase
MKNYLELMDKILYKGSKKTDRTGTGTISLFGEQLRFNLEEGFPLVTTKKVHFKSIVHELLWFLKGDTNTKYLNDNGVSIWDKWSTQDGDLGKIYGKQWIDWNGINQVEQLIANLKNNPYSRRHLISVWNVDDLPDESISPQENVKEGKMALAPCHAFWQCYVVDGKLSLQLYQRSADYFIGTPFNIASYALLTMMIAQQCNLKLGDLIITFGDVHIYLNHVEQALVQLKREPYTLPVLKINKAKSIFDYKYEDFELVNYESHPVIKAVIAV